MIRITKYPLLAVALPAIAFSAVLAVAQGTRGMMHHGGFMGHGTEGCAEMMQVMRGEAQRPNDQWRQRYPQVLLAASTPEY